jgi:hypothetical protein
VVQATAAWCDAYGVDRNFWAERNIGSRVCTWFDIALAKDPAAFSSLTNVADELFRCLDMLVQSGVAAARVLEDRIANPEIGRKTG